MSVRYKIVDFSNRPWTDLEQDFNQQGSNGWALHELRNQVGIFRDQYGNASSTTAFGEPLAIPLTPVIQLDAIYGITSNDYETFTATTGNVESSGSIFLTHTGTGAYGYGVIRSKRLLRYRPGQGALARFTAGFSTPASNTIQRAGLFSQEQGLFVGNEGTIFGVTRQNGGKAHIYKLDITTGAGGAETATVQLNGTNYSINLVSGGGPYVASQIVASSSAFLGQYTMEAISSSVYFAGTSLANKTGSVSFSSATAAGTVTTIRSGSDNVVSFTSQSEFSIDTLDGNGPSGMILDPSKLNVYQINFRWLGAGEIRYAIENEESGDMIFFHHEHYTNQYTVPHLDNPSFKIGYISADVGGTGGTDVHTYGSSLLGAIEGNIEITGYPTAVSSTQASLSSGDINHLITVRNNLIFKDKINLKVTKLKQMSVAYNGNNPAEVILYLNATGFSTNHVFTSEGIDSNTAHSDIDGIFTNPGTPLAIFVVQAGGDIIVNLEELNIVLAPQSSLTVALRSGNVITRAICGLTYTEF